MKRGIKYQRNYAGEWPRPSVVTYEFAAQSLVIIGTPWGSSDALHQLSDTLREFMAASQGDQEATSPFARLPGLTTQENRLRSGALLANDAIFTKFNKEAYGSSCEALILAQTGTELSWVQVGQPHLFLIRNERLHPLQFSLDLGLDYSNPTPLPSRLFGIDRHCDFETKSVVLAEGDRVLALARSEIPASLLTIPAKQDDFVSRIYDLTVHDNPKMPFWLGLIG